MVVINSNVSLGEKTSFLGTNLFSSRSFMSKISFTKLSKRLICEIIIFTSLSPMADKFSVKRLSMNIRVVASGVRNS